MTRPLLEAAAASVTLAFACVTWAAGAPTRCSDLVGHSAQLNAVQLFDAVAPCVAEKRSFEAELLLVESQIRAPVDLELLAPKADEDKLSATRLYGLILYQTAGAGDRELYRDPATTQAFLDRIEAWVPTFGAEYDPGWHYRRRPSESEYGDAIQYEKSYRVALLRWYASLVRNDRYYAAESEMADIRERNPTGIVPGSSDFARYKELSQTMNQISKGIEGPKLPRARRFVYKPDPDADFKQVFVGFNGPDRSDVTVFQSEADVSAGWIGSAIPSGDLRRILSQVKFDSQIVIALAVGETETATGQVYVVDASYNALLDSFGVTGLVGVNDADCKLPRAKSYPYVIVVAPRPPKVTSHPGFGFSTFRDGCKQPKTGAPSASAVPAQ